MSQTPAIKGVAEAIYNELLADLILTTALSAHREIKRGRTQCAICGTRCRAHDPLVPPSQNPLTLGPPLDGSVPPTRTASPQPPLASTSSSQEIRSGGYTVGPEKGTGGSTGIGSGSGRVDGSGNTFFDCLVCGRPVASNRYSPHLSSCLGLNGSTRRGAARSAAVKARLGTNDRSSPSPYLQGSDNGDSDVDSISGKKSKKGLNGNGKRGRSPSKTSVLGKKTKFSPSSGANTPSSHIPRQSLPPSKLGQPPTSGFPSGRSSPVSSPSPEFSVVSSQGTQGTQETGGAGGMTGAKTLPGAVVGSVGDGSMLGDDGAREAPQGYESSEADDY